MLKHRPSDPSHHMGILFWPEIMHLVNPIIKYLLRTFNNFFCSSFSPFFLHGIFCSEIEDSYEEKIRDQTELFKFLHILYLLIV
jgi:hypothetical protein